MSPDLAALAARQLADYDAGTPGTEFAQGVQLDVDEAYRVQAEMCRMRQERGEALLGYKVGCTSPAIQEQFGIRHPVFGCLFHSERHRSGARLRCLEFDHLAIEGELAVTLGEISAQTPTSDEAWFSVIETVFPVIELHNYVFRSVVPNAAELIANNALHAGIVEPSPLQGRVTLLNAELELSIHIDGVLVDRCPGDRLAAPLLDSLKWLASALPEYGLTLFPGMTILTGSQMKLIPVGPPDCDRDATRGCFSKIAVDGGPLGIVEAEVHW